MFVYTHTLDSGVLIWRTQPYSSSVRIICISQLISMSTPEIWFEAKWGRHSRTALEAGSDTSAPQSCPERERSQPSRDKQVNDESRVEDPAALRCPEGLLNPEAPKGNPCPGRGHISHKISQRNMKHETWAVSSSHHISSSPIQTKQSHSLPGFLSATPPTAFSQEKYGIPRVLPQPKIWPSAGCCFARSTRRLRELWLKQ